MKRKIRYEDLTEINGEPIGELGPPIPDFLPSPDVLAGRAKSIKVTLALDVRSVDYFKKTARQLHVPYQRMIRNLVARYTASQQSAEGRSRVRTKFKKRR